MNGQRMRNQEIMEAGRGELAIAQFLSLCGLRGMWPLSSFNDTGNAYDLSGQSRTLTYNGNPVYDYDGQAPYIAFDGAGDYLHRADEAGLDILGNEAYVGTPGLTVGGWFYLGSLAANQTFISKYSGAVNHSWTLQYLTANSQSSFEISNTGADSFIVNSDDGSIEISKWYFNVGRFEPSTRISNYLNGIWSHNLIAIPATIRNSTANLRIGMRSDGTVPLTGRASMNFLCASALSDATISFLFNQTRAMYGV